LNSNFPVFPTEPKPVKEYFDLNNKIQISKIRSDLFKKSGIYGFINNINGKRYKGSGVDLYRRFLDHLKGQSTNVRLQKAIKAHGIDKFSFLVYAFAEYTMPTITDMETLFMSYFSKEFLYNFQILSFFYVRLKT
jgi:group I intron endonuclease